MMRIINKTSYTLLLRAVLKCLLMKKVKPPKINFLSTSKLYLLTRVLLLLSSQKVQPRNNYIRSEIPHLMGTEHSRNECAMVGFPVHIISLTTLWQYMLITGFVHMVHVFENLDSGCPYNAERFLYKPRRPKGFGNFKSLWISQLALSASFIMSVDP